jgi:hypothetical protein
LRKGSDDAGSLAIFDAEASEQTQCLGVAWFVKKLRSIMGTIPGTGFRIAH